MGTGTFPGVKRPGRGVDHPLPSSAEVKERVKLYLYSPTGRLWPVLGRTLLLPFTFSVKMWVSSRLECRHTRTALYHPCSRPACMLLLITSPACRLPDSLAVNRLVLSGRILVYVYSTSEPSWIVTGSTLPSSVLKTAATDSFQMAPSHYMQQNPFSGNSIDPPTVTYLPTLKDSIRYGQIAGSHSGVGERSSLLRCHSSWRFDR